MSWRSEWKVLVPGVGSIVGLELAGRVRVPGFVPHRAEIEQILAERRAVRWNER